MSKLVEDRFRSRMFRIYCSKHLQDEPWHTHEYYRESMGFNLFMLHIAAEQLLRAVYRALSTIKLNRK